MINHLKEYKTQNKNFKQMKNIQLTLSIEETNVLLQSLANMPYGQVAELISKIQQTAQSQLEPAVNGEAVPQKAKTGK